MGAKGRAVGFLQAVKPGYGKPCLWRSIMVGYPTVSAVVGFRSWKQRKLFSLNEYHVLPACALIGLNSLSMVLAGLHVP